jgi:hypothetical protein
MCGIFNIIYYYDISHTTNVKTTIIINITNIEMNERTNEWLNEWKSTKASFTSHMCWKPNAY